MGVLNIVFGGGGGEQRSGGFGDDKLVVFKDD